MSSSSLNASVFIIMCFSLMLCYALVESHQTQKYHTFNVTSLLSTSTCRPSVQGPSRPASLRVTHMHGPCSKLGKGDKNVQTLAEVLARDQIRVASIQKRYASNAKFDKQSIASSESTVRIPAKSGRSLGTGGNYLVSVGLGTPAKYLNLVFDTGSSLTWTQCEPCAGSCYTQPEPIFNPASSSSYSNVSCNSAKCSQLLFIGYDVGCFESTCIYGTSYGDRSFTEGFLANERLTLTQNDVFDEFLFGCGENNSLRGHAAGLLGLGPESLSVVSQTANKFEKYFSYCLPTISGSDGHLSFGKNGDTGNFKFTPFARSSGSSFYHVSIVGISVNGRQLPISPSVYQSGGSIIDSGTTITYLAPTIYTALRDAFRQEMSKYPSAPAISPFDTCYDFTNYTNITPPIISFSFAGNVKIDLDIPGMFFALDPSQVCLAFAGNNADTDVGIYGNVQQQTFEIAYDIAGGRLGFGPAGGCS